MACALIDKEPGLEAGHASFQTRKTGCVNGRPGKFDKEMRSIRHRTYWHSQHTTYISQ